MTAVAANWRVAISALLVLVTPSLSSPVDAVTLDQEGVVLGLLIGGENRPNVAPDRLALGSELGPNRSPHRIHRRLMLVEDRDDGPLLVGRETQLQAQLIDELLPHLGHIGRATPIRGPRPRMVLVRRYGGYATGKTT
jgi:hypothetical protein